MGTELANYTGLSSYRPTLVHYRQALVNRWDCYIMVVLSAGRVCSHVARASSRDFTRVRLPRRDGLATAHCVVAVREQVD